MKYSVNSKSFGKTLSAVAKIINKRNSLPVMTYALLSQNDEKYYLTGTNGEHYLTIRVDDFVVVEESNFTPVCLDVQRILQLLSALPEQPVELTIAPDTMRLNIKYQGGHFEFPCVDAAPYPVVPDVKTENVKFEIPADVFLASVKEAALSVSASELRPVMCCVAMDVRQDGVVFVGTDGHTLYKNTYTHGVPFCQSTAPNLKDGDREAMPLLHFGAIAPLSTVFSDKDMVSVAFDGQKTLLESDGVRYVIRNVDGRYPNYNSVIPKESNYHIIINRGLLEGALKRVALMASESSCLVVLQKNGMFLALNAKDLDFAQVGNEELQSEECTVPDGFKIGFNYKNLLKMIGCVATDNIRIELSDATRAVLLKEEDPNSTTECIVMPMVIES